MFENAKKAFEWFEKQDKRRNNQREEKGSRKNRQREGVGVVIVERGKGWFGYCMEAERQFNAGNSFSSYAYQRAQTDKQTLPSGGG